MDKLNADQRTAIAGLIRGQARLIRDLTAARALLKFCEENKLHPVKYERALEEIKQKPEYQEIARGLDLIASHLEQSAEEIDLNELLQKLPQGKPAN
jgi:uncharacterized membrane protein YfbV (UPF0208 family)